MKFPNDIYQSKCSKSGLYIFFSNYMFKFKSSLSVFESFVLLNGIPVFTLIHYNLPQGTPCIAKTAWSFPVSD